MKKILIFVVGMVCVGTVFLNAETIDLKNGDRVRGEIINASADHITLRHAVMGDLKISMDQIVDLVRQNIKVQCETLEHKNTLEQVRWKGNLELGLNISNGNTDEESLYGKISLKQTVDARVNRIKLESYYGSDDGVMTEQKWSTSVEQTRDVADTPWFFAYKFEADHDRFANIDYRLIPSVGTGYHWINTDSTILDVKVAGAFQSTHYRDNTSANDEFLFIPGFHFERSLFEKSKLIVDGQVFPSFDSDDGFRAKVDASFITPVSDRLSYRISVSDEYDSEPGSTTFKNDVRVLSSLVYSI